MYSIYIYIFFLLNANVLKLPCFFLHDIFNNKNQSHFGFDMRMIVSEKLIIITLVMVMAMMIILRLC